MKALSILILLFATQTFAAGGTFQLENNDNQVGWNAVNLCGLDEQQVRDYEVGLLTEKAAAQCSSKKAALAQVIQFAHDCDYSGPNNVPRNFVAHLVASFSCAN